MNTATRYEKVIAFFSETMPAAQTELQFGNPYQLLVAVMLSAQCTDRRVNQVTPALFEAFPTVRDMAAASPEAIFPYIASCSYPNSKADHLWRMAVMVCEKFHGEIPDTAEALQSLPGVGRKTANVMIAVAFGRPAMPVDTHVFRVSHRIGLVRQARTPAETERQLTRHIPEHLWSIAHHWLILHGRYVCLARKPRCGTCGLADVCQFCQRQQRANLS